MPVAVNMPNQKESSLDKIAKGLQIAQSVYGIKADMSALEKAKKQESLQAEQLDRENTLRAEQEAPDSVLYKSVTSRAQNAGIKLPDGMNFRQAKESGLLGSIEANEQARRQRESDRLKAADERMTKLASEGNKRLPADKVLSVNEGNEMPNVMGKLEKTIKLNGDLFGPFQGRIGGLNAYDDRSQAVQSQFKASAQLVGKFMEDGVLRKEDEAKYEKMLPTLADTPATAANKLAIVRNMLASKQASNLKALQMSGYDTGGLNSQSGDVPDLPGVLTVGKTKDAGLVPEALAGGKTSFTADDLDALSWAKENPMDPRAPEILNRLRMKGLE